jgi:hypothetical protein
MLLKAAPPPPLRVPDAGATFISRGIASRPGGGVFVSIRISFFVLSPGCGWAWTLGRANATRKRVTRRVRGLEIVMIIFISSFSGPIIEGICIV